MRDPQRPAVFLIAVLAHAGLLYLLASYRHSTSADAPDRQSTVLVFLEDAPERRRPPVEVAPIASEPRLETVPTVSQPRAAAERSVPDIPAEDSEAPPPIDWRREAEEAGLAHVLEAEANAPREQPAQQPRKKSEFRWSRSQVNRVEPAQGGGVTVRLSERCVLVISVIVMPACKVGKIPVHGDLFEHMRDPPTLGDWKDE
jgi:hypothetical protein